jgi:HD superfamily phosphodiesterase
MSLIAESNIITAAEDYVRHIYENKMPPNTYKFHNWTHLIQVRDEVLVLAKQSGVPKDDMEMLNLAALFHDCGFSETFSAMKIRASAF